VHPLTRLKLRMPIDTKETKVSIRLLGAFEYAKLSTSIPDLMARDRALLTLEPCIIDDRPASAWRCPDMVDVRSENHDLRYSVSPESLLEQLKKLPVNFPLELGSCLALRNKRYSGMVYRLSLASDGNSPNEEATGFVLVHSLPILVSLNRCTLQANVRRSLVPSIIHAPPSGTQRQLLPHESFFSSSLLRLVEVAAAHSGIVLYGERGSGKTFCALTMAATRCLKEGCSSVYLDCRKLRDSRSVRMNNILAEISCALSEAAKSSPCVLIFDDLDELIPTFSDMNSSHDPMHTQQSSPAEIDQSKLIADFLRVKLRCVTREIVLIATCQSEGYLPSSVLCERRLCHRFAVPDIEEKDRKPLFHCFMRRQLGHSIGPDRHDAEFARKTLGFRPRDFERLACRLCRNKGSHAQWDLDASRELEVFVALSRLGAMSEPTITAAKFSSLGGLRKAKSMLTTIVLQPVRYSRIFERARIQLPLGILLYGFPGTGKTMCGPALANECGLPLIMCRGPELLDKYIGASEAKIRELFARASVAAPSILFIDELDALAPRRGSDHSGVTDRIVNQLLTFLDGVESTSNNGRVYIVATSSRPDKIDPALLRPGRLEKHVYFGFPEDDDDISDLLSCVANRFSLDPDASAAINSGDFVKIARQENIDFLRLSPADFKAAFGTAQLSAAHEALSSGRISEKASISFHHLLQSFRSLRPSLVPSDFQRLTEVYEAFGKPTPPNLLARRSMQLRTALK
jgi:SpoVK/Ycf46/Vps4 family AAA+-type ATPase